MDEINSNSETGLKGPTRRTDSPEPADKRAPDGRTESATDNTATQGDAPDQAAEQNGKPARERKPIIKRPAFLIFILVAIIAIIAIGLYWWFYKRPYETTDDAFIGADIVQISPQVSGLIVKAPIQNNAHVDTGDLLAEIDPASAKTALATVRAQREQAKANLQQATVGVEQAKDQEAEAEAKLSALEVTAQNDQDTLTRDLKLQKASSSPITQKQIDNDRATARTAEAQAEASRRAVTTAKTGISVARAKVQSAKASLDSAESQVQQKQLSLDHTTIHAPVDGQIVQKNINLGSFATQGQPMMALVPDAIYVTANFKETQLSDIHIGTPADIHVDAYPGVDFHGKVVSIQHGAGQAFQLLPPQNATGNFVKVVQRVPVRISIEAPDLSKYPLGPGMSVVPSIKVR